MTTSPSPLLEYESLKRMNITIEQIATHHVDGFRECLEAVAAERRFLGQTSAPPREQMLTFVEQSVRDDVAQFVALDGKRVIGWCDVFPAWADAVSHTGTLGMGVLIAYRRQGLGRRLLETTLTHAKQKGLTRIELEVRVDNAAAIRLYEGAGFTIEGRKRRAMRFDGEYFDALTMALLDAP